TRRPRIASPITNRDEGNLPISQDRMMEIPPPPDQICFCMWNVTVLRQAQTSTAEMHNQKLYRMRFRGHLSPVLRPRGRIGKRHCHIETDGVVRLGLTPAMAPKF